MDPQISSRGRLPERTDSSLSSNNAEESQGSSSRAVAGASQAHPAPPKSSPTKTPEQDDYHEQNRRFLEQVANQQHQQQQESRATIAMPQLPSTLPRPTPPPSLLHSRKPSLTPPITTSKKTHQRLPSIDERLPDVFTSIHHRTQSDEISAMSIGSWWSGAVDTGGGGGGVGGGDDTTPSSPAASHYEERIALLEEAQDAQFEQTKEELEEQLLQSLQVSSNSEISSSPLTEREKHTFIQKYLEELDRERQTLLEQWKAEWETERKLLEEQERKRQLQQRQRRRKCSTRVKSCLKSIAPMMATLEVFLANLPLTIGAVGLSWVTMGTVWFKFMEEMSPDCHPVHYYAPTCHFPEFPGCFDCTNAEQHSYYQVFLYIHYICSTVAGVCCLLFCLKVLIAWKLVADELSNPTTSTPMGVVCIAVVCVFAGRGKVGEFIVLLTSWFHLALSLWFLYMAVVRFGLWPDPGWFPNTVGMTYGAVKTFLYFPTLGLFFLSFAVVFFFAIFFISLVRVAVNPKIAAPIAWIGLSAPSITMYALTLVSQPTRQKEELLEHDAFLFLRREDWMQHYYLPLQHFMMILSLVGLASAVSALVVRWNIFSKRPFSPAHVAFCFPTLSHTNAVQAYRGAVNAYSTLPPTSAFHQILFGYWCFFLVVGTLLNLIFTAKYIRRLPEWTKLNVTGEEAPPAPKDTFVYELLATTNAHEHFLDQPFVSPAVLQANEAGALVRVRRGTQDFRIHGPYVRSRRVSALGFNPTMDEDEFRRERAQLLDWVAKNAPRKRNRTMSNPIFLQQNAEGIASGLYGTFGNPLIEEGTATQQDQQQQHKRSVTTTDLGLPGL